MRMSSLPACTISLSRFVRIVESDGGCGECNRAKAVSPSLGRLVRRAAMTETQKWFVSLSSASRESQTQAGSPPVVLRLSSCRVEDAVAHDESRVVFPLPAEAETSVKE